MKKDNVYLKHILDAISDIEKFMQGVSEEQFFGNKEKQYAVLRGLEIIGEATKNLSVELKAKSSDVDWKNIACLFWRESTFGLGAVKKDVPQLKKQASKMLKNFNNT